MVLSQKMNQIVFYFGLPLPVGTYYVPFSGLCMHPVEHLYCFTCYAPCLLLKLHPFVLFWMGFHVVLSPAASHSGYEDHFSADLGHYLHHRHADCNYGAGVPFDKWFGTYRDKLNATNTTTVPPDPKATLVGGILPEHPPYQVLCVGLVLGTVLAWRDIIWMRNPQIAAAVFSTAPCWIVFGLSAVLFRKTTNKKKSLWAPFDKDSSASLLLHVGLGIVLGIFPATYLIDVVLSSPPA
jgi:hypothetical protein